MSSNSSTPPDDHYFNDLSRQNGTNGNKRPRTNEDGYDGRNGNGTTVETTNSAGNNEVPKPKRIACIICRKRKLKCDGTKPSCSTCTRLNHNCSYDEVRRKSGPKRGYVKALEERLKQVETLLSSKETSNHPVSAPTFAPPLPSGPPVEFDVPTADVSLAIDRDSDRWRYVPTSPQPAMEDNLFDTNMAGMTMGMDDTTFSWEMIGLGLEEPLPKQEIIDELHQIYFDKIHPSLPMIHKYRYLAAMNLAPTMRPPVALRYAMWTLAASITEKYMDLKDHFYQRSRKYVEMDEMKGHGEHMITIAHSQTQTLLASYEFKMMYFPRAWMSTGKAIRLAQMMGLHRIDGKGLEVKQCLPAARDWTETEERRRTFWMAFCEDRYASIGTGWPMTIEEKDILTDLPASEEAFEMSKPETTQSLPDALCPSGAGKLSAFAGVILMACLFGRNLIHLHRPDTDDRDNDLNGEFWKRHRNMDNILLNTSLSLPSHLKLPNGLGNPNIVFTNMNIHTSTICLHQAAIFKADKNNLPATVSTESKVRCITAAGEIASIMRMISHLDLSAMNPFISFCLYVAARVFVQYLKTHPENGQADDSLFFLLSAMNALKKKNPLTESFLVQLDVDLEGLGMRNPKYRKATPDNTAFVQAFMQENNGKSNVACGASLLNDPHSNNSPPRTTQSSGQPNFEPLNWLPVNEIPTTQPSNIPIPSQAPSNNVNTFAAYMPNQNRGPSSRRSGYNHSDSGGEMDLSPVSGSNRLTPNSTAASDSRTAHSGNGNGTRTPNPNNAPNPGTHSSHTRSYETSPATAHQNVTSTTSTSSIPATTAAYSYHNNPTSHHDYGSMAYGIDGEIGHGRDYVVPNWESGGTGMTPVGEGMLNQLLGLGSMEMGWDGEIGGVRER